MKKAQFPVRKLRPHNVVLSARWQKASHFEWDSLNGLCIRLDYTGGELPVVYW